MTTEHRLHYIMKLDGPHERLRKLNAELSPSTFEQESILLQQYHEIKKYPKQANVSDWLDRYEALIELMEEAKLAEVSGARAQAEFLLSVQGADDSWATAQRIKLIKKQRTANDFTSIRDLIQEYRLWWRQTKPVAASLSSFTGTLGDNMNTRSYQDARYNCPCGASHRFDDCAYINPSKRASDWKADPEVKKQFDAIRSRGTENKLAQALRAADARHKNGKPKPLAFNSRSAGSGRGRPGEAGALLTEGASIGVPQNDQTEASDCLQAAATRRVTPTLLRRWILNGGSNVHVANHRNKSWKKISDAQASDVIFAGEQRIQIEEWGNVQVLINTPAGTQLVLLTWVALIPSFFTSLVSLSRVREVNIEFDSGRDGLYQKQTGDLICELQYTNGHWILDSDGNDRPALEEDFHFMATAATETKRKQRRRGSR